jgi:hypothetical protein
MHPTANQISCHSWAENESELNGCNRPRGLSGPLFRSNRELSQETLLIQSGLDDRALFRWEAELEEPVNDRSGCLLSGGLDSRQVLLVPIETHRFGDEFPDPTRQTNRALHMPLKRQLRQCQPVAGLPLVRSAS